MDDLQALAVSVISVADFVAFSAFFGSLVFVFFLAVIFWAILSAILLFLGDTPPEVLHIS